MQAFMLTQETRFAFQKFYTEIPSFGAVPGNPDIPILRNYFSNAMGILQIYCLSDDICHPAAFLKSSKIVVLLFLVALNPPSLSEATERTQKLLLFCVS